MGWGKTVQMWGGEAAGGGELALQVVGAWVATQEPMSSLENIYQKMVPSLEPHLLAQLHDAPPSAEQETKIGREVAHELNNILTIIQGYSERLMMRHGQDAGLRADLQLIANNARRAVGVIRQARPPKPAAVPGPH